MSTDNTYTPDSIHTSHKAKIIIRAISGKRFSGKDHHARILYENLSNCYIMALADIAKQEFCEKFSYDYDLLRIDRAYKEGLRSELITYAEGCKDRGGPGYWVDRMYERIKKLPEFSSGARMNIVVSDLRLKEELKRLRELPNTEVITIRIITPDVVRKERGWVFNEGVDLHRTECDLDDVKHDDYIIGHTKNKV